jgi:hypothetical protein
VRLIFLVLVCLASPLAAQTAGVVAARVPNGALRLDGRLSDEQWGAATPVGGFVQREPTEGEPARDRTDVRFAYDDEALWIGARMYSRNPRDIRALVTRRDREGSSEQLIVSLDTHRDRRTAYGFAVTPAGVRIDYFHAADFENERNYDFDPVWEAKSHIDSIGWTAELRIPFTQLRFNPGDVQEWGVNLTRVVPQTNESSYLVLVRRNETGWASRMAVLTGIRGIKPGRRVELLPYVAADSRFRGVVDPADPFSERRESGVRAGGDVKMGLGPNMTLELTINPDFGQVEADPAVVNLSAYETFFDERRPFFLEGSQLFGGRNFYYSRRIGATPPGSGDADYEERVNNTTILGAAKLTGRLPSGLSIGALAALTDRESIRTYDAGTNSFGRADVAPMTTYAVASAQQEFGRTRSTYGATVTMVQRDLQAGSPLEAIVAKSAYSAMADTRLRWAGGMYDLSAFIGVTSIDGDSSAILRQQLSSRRYWQRPGADHVELNPSRRELGGTYMGIGHSKVSGRHWLWDIDYAQQSPGLEPNDIGAFGDVDNRLVNAGIRYRETVPRGWYRSWIAGVGADASWNFGGDRTETELEASANAVLSNFWRANTDAWYGLRSMSDALTRGGPLMQTPAIRGVSLELQSRSGARNGWGVEIQGETDDAGGWEREIELSFSYRPGTQLELSFDPSWDRQESSRQFVASRAGGPEATFGRRYVFAHVDLSEIAARIRANYTFSPELSLETYVEPFASSGEYHTYGELGRARGFSLRSYGENGTTVVLNADGTRTVTADGQTFSLPDSDFNVRSLRSNVVLRWEWRAGSTLYLVWQQDRSADREVRRVRPSDILGGFDALGDNVLALKASYWLPIGGLR